MPTEPHCVVVIGAGGHAKVVMDALLVADEGRSACFADDDAALAGTELLGRRVDGSPFTRVQAGNPFHVAIGHNGVRRRLHESLAQAGGVPQTVIHPAAIVSPRGSLGLGVFVAAGAVVAPSARLDDGVIVNHGAVIDHDCRVGAFSHIAPRATLGGAVTVGQAVLVGAGATVLPGVTLGDGAIVGAGAVVLSDVPAGQLHYGVPARSRKKELK